MHTPHALPRLAVAAVAALLLLGSDGQCDPDPRQPAALCAPRQQCPAGQALRCKSLPAGHCERAVDCPTDERCAIEAFAIVGLCVTLDPEPIEPEPEPLGPLR